MIFGEDGFVRTRRTGEVGFAVNIRYANNLPRGSPLGVSV